MKTSLTLMYLVDDQEFSVWPLTHDFEANPFRYDIETGRGSPLLRHSIMALSYKHMNRATGAYVTEAKLHKKKAIKLLEELETDIESSKSRANLLNGLLILMTLDVSNSTHAMSSSPIKANYLLKVCHISPRPLGCPPQPCAEDNRSPRGAEDPEDPTNSSPGRNACLVRLSPFPTFIIGLLIQQLGGM